jgi:ferrous iron transport protein A
MKTLNELNTNDRGIILKYKVKDKNFKNKILSMGLLKNTAFTIIRKAPLGDPIEIKIRNFELTLRKSEAELIYVELLKN